MEWHTVRNEVKLFDGDADKGFSFICQEGTLHLQRSLFILLRRVSEQLSSHSLHFCDSEFPTIIFLFLHEAREYLFHFIDDKVFFVRFYYCYVLIFCFHEKSNLLQ